MIAGFLSEKNAVVLIIGMKLTGSVINRSNDKS